MLGSVGTKAAERLRRYEAGHSLDLHRSLNALAKLRKHAEGRPADPGVPSWVSSPAPAPNEPKPGPEAEAPNEPDRPEEAPAPNEPKPAGRFASNVDCPATCEDASAPARSDNRAPGAPLDGPPTRAGGV
jgi:hypothetical protein